VLFDSVEQLRIAAILLKPFLPQAAERIYRSFNFPQPWEQVRCRDAYQPTPLTVNVKLLAELEDGKVKPLFPRIG
jgi:methionyl-tRNA synthetase